MPWRVSRPYLTLPLVTRQFRSEVRGVHRVRRNISTSHTNGNAKLCGLVQRSWICLVFKRTEDPVSNHRASTLVSWQHAELLIGRSLTVHSNWRYLRFPSVAQGESRNKTVTAPSKLFLLSRQYVASSIQKALLSNLRRNSRCDSAQSWRCSDLVGCIHDASSTAEVE
jgi:hypothetical protein